MTLTQPDAGTEQPSAELRAGIEVRGRAPAAAPRTTTNESRRAGDAARLTIMRGTSRALLFVASVMSLSIVLLAAPTARAQTEALTWEGGSGGGVELWRLGFQRPHREFAAIGGWDVTLAWEFQAGRWRSRTDGRPNAPVWEIGITPVLRLERQTHGAWSAFVEGAVGAHLISRNKVHAKLDMSSAYQFGDHIGVGVRFRGVEIVLRHQHMSNASTVQPNHGINFNVLRAVYYLR